MGCLVGIVTGQAMLAASTPSNSSPPAAPSARASESEGAEVARRAAAYLAYLRAQELLQEGRWKEGRSELQNVLEADPDAAPVRAALARLCLREEDLACAEREARNAATLDPDDSSSRRVLADVLTMRYRREQDLVAYEAALIELEAATRLEPLDMSAWVSWIRLLGGEGRIDPAIEAARRAAAVPGSDPAVPWMAISRVLLSRGDAARAIELLDKVNVTGRAAIPILETLADLKSSRGDSVGVEATLTALERLKPDDAEVASRLGAVRLELGDPFAALAPLERALRARPNDAMVRRDLARAMVRLGRGQAALDLLAVLPEVYRSSHALLLWAQAAEQAGQPKLAAERLEDLLGRLSSEDQASFGAAVRLRAAQNWLAFGNAARALTLLTGLDNDVTALRLRYEAWTRQGKTSAVDGDVRARLAKSPHDPALAVLSMGWDRVPRVRDDEEALTHLIQLSRGAPDHTRWVLDACRWLLQFDRAALAARLIDAIGMSGETDREVLRMRAAALQSAGRMGEAEAAFRQLLQLEPDNDVIWNDLGWNLAQQGKSLDEAIRLLERAVQKRPEESAYLDSLGWALHRVGRNSEALPLLRHAARRAQERDEPEIREHLGDVYFALGDRQRARAEWIAALNLDVSSKERLQRKLAAIESEPEDTTPAIEHP